MSYFRIPSAVDGQLFYAKGPVVPPKAKTAERWEAIVEVYKANGAAAGALRSYLAAITASSSSSDVKQYCKKGLNYPNLGKWEASDPSKYDPEPKEHYSRVFRASHRLAGRYDLARTSSSNAGRDAIVLDDGRKSTWITSDIPRDSDQLAAVVLPTAPFPTLEMELQIEDVEAFMILAARSSSVGDLSLASGLKLTGMLVDVLIQGIAFVVYEAKALANVRRPYDFSDPKDQSSPLLVPSLPKPEHSSWPAGHAFVGGAMSVLLSTLSRTPDKKRLEAAAWRIAHNRVLAGLHTTLDTCEGLSLGSAVVSRLLEDAETAFENELAGGVLKPHERRLADLWKLVRVARSEW